MHGTSLKKQSPRMMREYFEEFSAVSVAFRGFREFRGRAVLILAVGVVGCAKTSGDSAAATASGACHDTTRPARPSRPMDCCSIKDLSADSMEGRAPGTPSEGQSGRLHPGAVQGDRAQAGQSRRHLSAERRSDRLQGPSDGVVVGSRKNRRAQVSRRLHRQLAP